MSNPVSITVANGDGIGPEIMSATLKIIKAAGANVTFDEIPVGESVYNSGFASGISDESWKTIFKNRIFLKAPITTPQGNGYKSLNVTVRKTLGLYANVRPCRSYAPFVPTLHKNIDVVIFRENEEDLYAGIDYRYTQDSCVAIKLTTERGCERIIRSAFEYAVKNKRKKITCMSKDNIMKMTDGVFFHEKFNEISQLYPTIEVEHYIIDIGAARLANRPQIFDVIVTLNLYGDIISDIIAEVAGSVGLAGSANIGDKYAMFEAIHGSAPLLAGKNTANPSGLLNGAIMMLAHIGQGSVAKKIENALLITIENGTVTKDLFIDGISKEKLGTAEFADAVISNLGKEPKTLTSGNYSDFEFSDASIISTATPIKTLGNNRNLVGVDTFIASTIKVSELYKAILQIESKNLQFSVLSSRGMAFDQKSAIFDEIDGDCYARFSGKNITQSDVIDLLSKLNAAGIEVVGTHNLYNFNDKRSYSVPQGC